MRDADIPIAKSLINFMENDDRNRNGKFYCELYADTFMHFRAGSNWNKEKAEVVTNRNSNFLSAITGGD